MSVGGLVMWDLYLLQWVDGHGLTALVIYWFVSAALGALDAPTATSGGFYKWFFKFCNIFGGNLIRALNTKLETSPNWQKAADEYCGQVNGEYKGDKKG